MSWWRKFLGGAYDFQVQPPDADKSASADISQPSSLYPDQDDLDPIYEEAVNFVLDSRRASISALQHKFTIGYNRAARLIEAMELDGIISPMDANGRREVIGIGAFDGQAAAKARQAALDAAESERIMRLNHLMEKYQDADIVSRIIDRTVWEGMTSAQLFDALGKPEAVDQKYLKKVSREVWKYLPLGAKRYAAKITLENGIVVGWDFKE